MASIPSRRKLRGGRLSGKRRTDKIIAKETGRKLISCVDDSLYGFRHIFNGYRSTRIALILEGEAREGSVEAECHPTVILMSWLCKGKGALNSSGRGDVRTGVTEMWASDRIGGGKGFYRVRKGRSPKERVAWKEKWLSFTD